MTMEEQIKKIQNDYFVALAQKAKGTVDLMREKAYKYNGEDWLEPFDQISSAASLTGISPEQAIRFMMNMKITRLNMGSDVVDDTKLDSIRDGIGYSLMLWEYLDREKNADMPMLNEGSYLPDIKVESSSPLVRAFKKFLLPNG